jgi:DNA-binding Xre family transcriptional regulator
MANTTDVRVASGISHAWDIQWVAMNLDEYVATELRGWRARRMMTQKSLSQSSAIPIATLQRRLYGEGRRGSMTLNELERIGDALGLVVRVELCAARDSNPEPAGSEPSRSWSRSDFELAA